MKPMEHSTAERSPAGDSLHTQADSDTDEREIPQIRSLSMPGLAKGPILPAWLRRLLGRADPPAAR
jgi:hypothetical protein